MPQPHARERANTQGFRQIGQKPCESLYYKNLVCRFASDSYPFFYERLSGDDTRRQLGQRGRRQPRLELVTMHSVPRMTLLYDQMAWNKLQDTLEHVSAGPKYEPP